MRPRKITESRKSIGVEKFRDTVQTRNRKQGDMRLRAPLAQSVERRYFIPIFKGLSLLCVVKTPFFHRTPFFQSKET